MKKITSIVLTALACALVTRAQITTIPTATPSGATTWTALQTFRANGIGVTPTNRILLTNTTAAAAGAQQMSPCLTFSGQGWKTNATAASQNVQWRQCLVPVQGAAAPQARLDFGYAINGGAFSTAMSLLDGSAKISGPGNQLTLQYPSVQDWILNAAGSRLEFIDGSLGGASVTIAGGGSGAGKLGIAVNPTYSLHVAPTTGATAGQTMFVQDATATTGATKAVLREGAVATSAILELQDSAGANPVGLSRNAAGVLEVNNGTAGTYRDAKLREVIVTTGTEGTCDSSNRGRIVFVAGGAGVADTWRICRKDAADAYAFTALF